MLALILLTSCAPPGRALVEGLPDGATEEIVEFVDLDATGEDAEESIDLDDAGEDMDSDEYAEYLDPEDLPEEEEFVDIDEYETLTDADATVFTDEDNGVWEYRAEGLEIVIQRMRDQEEQLTWYEVDIQCSEKKPLSYLTAADGGFDYPAQMARRNHAVLAITDDFYGFRAAKGKIQGIILRDGEILSEKTYASGRRAFPNLDVMAVFADGSMKCFESGAYTAEEYLAMGAVHTFAFGPILVTDGQPGPHMTTEKWYHYREARCAMGMIAPWHYVFIVADGYRQGRSRGVYLTWLSRRMLELGVTEALNLDGGGTTALVFMGRLLNRTGKSKRTVNSLIGFGRTD